MAVKTCTTVIVAVCFVIGAVSATGNLFVERIGNALHDSPAGVTAPNATFLMNDAVLSEGVLYAFAAFFRSLTPMRLQIWRLESNPNDIHDATYRLVYEQRVLPSILGKEVIYMASKLAPCFHVQSGDKLGVFHESEDGALSYAFEASEPSALIYQPREGSSLSVGDVVEFDALVFPYDLSIQAYIHTDMSLYSNISSAGLSECPEILIPDHDDFGPVEPPPPPQGETGERGPTGPRGDRGEMGPTGPQGERGEQGEQGERGQTGPAGVDGEDGEDGADGEQGEQGNTGEQGPQGERGEQGSMGATGPRGEQGPPGKVVYVDGANKLEIVNGQEEQEMFGSKYMHLILVIWLVVLSVLFVILACAVPCWIRRHNRRHRKLEETTETDVESQPHTMERYPSIHPATPKQEVNMEAEPVYATPWNTLKEGSEVGSEVETVTIDRMKTKKKNNKGGDTTVSCDDVSMSSALNHGDAIVVGQSASPYSSTDGLDMNY